MTRTLTLTILLLQITVAAIFAQGNKSKGLTGTVLDSVSGKPLINVTVQLRGLDGKVIQSQQTMEAGRFRLVQLSAGDYKLRFATLGYASKSQSLSIGEGESALDLGNIMMLPVSNELRNVVIVATKPPVSHEADKIIYDLQADPDSKSNTVMEMMRKVPLITVDAEDNIKVSGNSAYRIFINGKPSSLLERNPKDVLKSMPASTIQKIEVITTPSAKYDAEGLAGIINIITNKALTNGYNGNVNLSHRYPLGGPSAGASFTSKSGKFGISAFGGGSLANTPSTGITISRNATEGPASHLFQYAKRESDNRNAYLGTEFSYEIDSLILFSVQLNLNGSNGNGEFEQNSRLMASEIMQQGYDLLTNNDNTGKGADAALNYQHGFRKDKNRLLTFSYRFYGFKNADRTDQLFSNRVNYDLLDFYQVNASFMAEHTAQLDYVHPLKSLTIEAGLKGIFRANESDFDYFADAGAGNYLIDATRSNTFNNTQSILAAYNTYQYNFKKDWSVKAGLRLEHTAVDADFVSTSSQVEQHYLSFVPSVSFSKRFGSRGINFGWNQRIQRPGINQLNPFIDRSNPIFENTGNPNLRPTKGNQVRMGFDWSKKVSLSVNLMYNWIRGLIFQVSDFDPETNITRTQYENTGGAKALGGNVNFNWPITKAWNMSLNGNVAHGWADGFSGGKPIRNQGFMYSANLSTGLRLDKGWKFSGSINLNGGDLTVQQNTNAFVSTNFNVNKDLFKEKLTLSIFSNNPFDRYRINVTNRFGSNFFQVNNSQQNFRTTGASLSYKFGKLKEEIRKNKRGIKNDDVSN